MNGTEVVDSGLGDLIATLETTTIKRLDSDLSVCFGEHICEYKVTAYRVGEKMIRIDLKIK